VRLLKITIAVDMSLFDEDTSYHQVLMYVGSLRSALRLTMHSIVTAPMGCYLGDERLYHWVHSIEEVWHDCIV
jgi:hypothetical protein